jgi:hypothetical protein
MKTIRRDHVFHWPELVEARVGRFVETHGRMYEQPFASLITVIRVPM